MEIIKNLPIFVILSFVLFFLISYRSRFFEKTWNYIIGLLFLLASVFIFPPGPAESIDASQLTHEIDKVLPIYSSTPLSDAPVIFVEATGAMTDVSLSVPAATDLVDGAIPPTVNPRGPFGIGRHTVTWSATDTSGNTGTKTQVVVVMDGAPVVTPPPYVLKETTGSTTIVNLGTATAVDNIDGPLNPTASPTGPFTVGIHIITWSVDDSAGNTGTATQKIIVWETTAPRVLTVEATGPTTIITNQITGMIRWSVIMQMK